MTTHHDALLALAKRLRYSWNFSHHRRQAEVNSVAAAIEALAEQPDGGDGAADLIGYANVHEIKSNNDGFVVARPYAKARRIVDTFFTIPVYARTPRAEQERCESGDPECGPVEFHDSEGVPLCQVCYVGLLNDSEQGEESSTHGRAGMRGDLE